VRATLQHGSSNLGAERSRHVPIERLISSSRSYCPIALYPAASEREKVRFHQINRETGHRIKYQKADADIGVEVPGEDIIKGYEVGKGHYLELAPKELDAVAIESTHAIEIDAFVPRSEIDELYLRDPYYLLPDGNVGQQAFAVIRQTIRKEDLRMRPA
jgi:DNA end-binding protein Ku